MWDFAFRLMIKLRVVCALQSICSLLSTLKISSTNRWWYYSLYSFPFFISIANLSVSNSYGQKSGKFDFPFYYSDMINSIVSITNLINCINLDGLNLLKFALLKENEETLLILP